MRLSPVLDSIGVYPFTRLEEAKRAAAARGVQLIDFGQGVPREPTPQFVRDAFSHSTPDVSTYPLSPGLPEFREAVAGWISRRYGAQVDADTDIVPTIGSKEPIFHLAQVVAGEAVAVTAPGYPVPERGAMFAGKDIVTLPIEAATGYLPDLDRVPWERLAILWLNYPNNPTGAVVDLGYLEQAAALAREHDVVLACDEAYSEIWLEGDAPASGLQLADRTNVIVFNTLSKRSSMPGYRIGFAAGDPDLVGALNRFRPYAGVTPPAMVQRAAIAAYSDESHVEAMRAGYSAKRDLVLPALEHVGLTHVGGPATFFLWMTTPIADEQQFAFDLVEKGIVCAPGSMFGPYGKGHLRVALVPTLADCERAVQILT